MQSLSWYICVVEGETGLGEREGEIITGSIGELSIGLFGEDKWGRALTFWKQHLNFFGRILHVLGSAYRLLLI